MSFGYVGDLISTSRNTSEASWTTSATLITALGVGQLGILVLACDNFDDADGVPNQISMNSDSAGNAWHRVGGYVNGQAAANAGADVSIWWTIATANLGTSGTFTFNFNNGNRTAKALVGAVFSVSDNFIGVEAYTGLANDGADAGSQTLAALASREYLFVRGMATESTSTTFTPSTNYTSMGAAASAGAMGARGEYRILTGTGDSTDPTTVANDQASLYVALRELRKLDIVAYKRITATGSTANATSYATSSVTLRAGYRALAWVYSEAASPNTPTATGWTNEASVASGNQRLTLLSRLGSGSAATNTWDFAGQTQSRCSWNVVETDSLGGSVIQSVAAAGASATLAAFANATNAAFVGHFLSGSSTAAIMGPESGWNVINSALIVETSAYALLTAWRPDGSDLTPTATAGTLTIACEVEKPTAGFGSFTLSGQPTNDPAAFGSFALTGGATADPEPRHTLIMPSLSGELLAAPRAITKRWFRNGVAPPGPASKRLGDSLNVLMARRGRILFSKRNTYALHANFDSATNSDITTWRGAFHTGPTTRKVRMRMVLLPLPGDVVISTDAYVQWTLRTGLTGAGVATVQASIIDAGLSSSASFTADEGYTVEQEWEVAADAHYRVELHQVNRARPLSAVIYEVPRTELQTDQDPGVDVSSIYVSGPIVRGPLDAMMQAADLVWRIGHPLGAWCTDLPADVLARTLATLRNAFDQTVTAPSSTSPGWPINVPYSGSLESGEVPVVLWAYASCVSGTGTIEWRDQDDNVIGSVAPAGAAAWYATTGVLGDATAAEPTTQIDPFIAGDATNALNVFALGMFMHQEEL